MKQRTPSRKPAALDWHPADVKAALEKAGWTCRRLSTHHGFHPVSIQKALRQSWPKAERLIAEAIDRKPQQVWPSRYNRDGTRKRGLSPRKYTNSDSGASGIRRKVRHELVVVVLALGQTIARGYVCA